MEWILLGGIQISSPRCNAAATSVSWASIKLVINIQAGQNWKWSAVVDQFWDVCFIREGEIHLSHVFLAKKKSPGVGQRSARRQEPRTAVLIRMRWLMRKRILRGVTWPAQSRDHFSVTDLSLELFRHFNAPYSYICNLLNVLINWSTKKNNYDHPPSEIGANVLET